MPNNLSLAENLDSMDAEAGIEDGALYLTDDQGDEITEVLGGWQILQTNHGPDMWLDDHGSFVVSGVNGDLLQKAVYDSGNRTWSLTQ